MANTYETGSTVYTSRQRAVSLTLGVACSLPLTSTMAMANGPMPPVMPFTHAVHAYLPSIVHGSFSHGGPVGVHTSVLSTGSVGNLNLSSSSLSFLANNLANFSSLQINVGGHEEQVNLTTKLTASEVVAVEQVITGGSPSAQTIKIGANGVADGGTVSLNSNLLTALDNSVGGSVSALTIAKGVQVVDSVNQLSLSGNLSNYGSLLTASGSSGSTDTITANNIVNAGGAAIGSYGGGGGLVGADPSLNALTSLTNSGTISSAGNVNISAPVVYNLVSHGSAASISAAGNVNINTQSLNNSGTIAAATGNVNVASTAGLNLAGAGGTLQANNGNINVSSTDADINVSGGNMISQQVNFNAGTGNVTAQLDDVTGVVNASGNCVHIGANSANLNLGAIDATGDPVFTNTGNLNIDNTIVGAAGAPLALIAGGNIVSAAGNSGLDTNAATGGALTIVAGAAFTQPGGAGTPVTVTKGSATGGEIDLTGVGANPILSINTSGTTQGGSIQMVAFAGTGAGSGSVIIPAGVPINAAGPTVATSGNVTIIAGAKSLTAISTGAIAGNTVSVDTSTPIISSKGVAFDGTGAQTSGTFTATATGNTANASVGNVTGTFDTVSGGTVNVANTTAALAIGTATMGKTGSLVASDTGGNITVSGVVSGLSSTLTTTGANTVTTSGTGSINTTTLNLNSGTGVDAVATNVTSLVLNTGANVTDTQGTSTIGVSGTVGGASTLTVNASGQVNMNGPLFIQAGTLDVTTTAADKGGISISAPIFLTTGTANLTNNGKGLLTETTGNVLTAATITLTSDTSIGTKTAGFQTNATALSVEDTGTKNISYINDQNIGTLTFNGNDKVAAGGSLFLTSTAATLNVDSANFATVSITDNLVAAGATGVVFNNATGVYGTGAGTFTVVSASGMTDPTAAIINGTTITLTATAPNANVGAAPPANPIFVNSANLVLNSKQGSVFVTDSLAATVNGAASLLGKFFVTDTGKPTGKETASLTVGKSVGGGDIQLQTSGAGTAIALTGTTGTATTGTVTILSNAGLTTKGAILGSSINFTTDGVVTFGGAVGNSSSSLTFDNTGTSPITLGGILTGNSISFTSAGPISVTKAVTGTGPNSSVTIDGTATSSTANAVTVGAAITGGTIKIGAGTTGSIAVNAAVGNSATAVVTISAGTTGAGGAITGTGLVSGTGVTLNAAGTAGSIGTSAKPFNTAAGTLSPNAAGTASDDGAFITQKGNLSLGSSTDSNLVIKVTGTLDVAEGATLVAPNLNLSASGTTTIDGEITNGAGPSSGTMVITSGGNFTVSQTGSIITNGDTKPVTINVTGTATVNGTSNPLMPSIAVQTLDLKASNGLTVGTTGVMSDGTDNLTITGPLVVNGQLGNSNGTTVFNVNVTGSVVIGETSSQATILGTGTIQGLSIINYVSLAGSVSFIGTGPGEAFQNYGTIEGLDVGVKTTNPAGVIFNASGAVIEATQQALTGGSPTLNLNTYGVDNQGTIGAIGLVAGAQGILNITSPGALTISGNNGSFLVGAFNAVNLKAAGNVTVGGVVGGVNSDPFSLFSNPLNDLGTFTVNTTGTFSSPLSGVSVQSNSSGSFGGNIAITASNVLFNGVAGTQTSAFFLNATGAGPLVSTSKTPLTLDLTGSQGITFGSNPGQFSANIEGFGNTSTTTLTTPGALNLNTASFDANDTSLVLTGTRSVLITGDLNEGTQSGTSIMITTANTSPFLIGGATTNGQNGLSTNPSTVGQGITADIITIFAPGAVTIGTSTKSPVDAVLNGAQSVTLNSQSLLINANSDVAGLGLTLNVETGNTSYTNLNANGAISASALTINDYAGITTLSSGSGNTVLTVGTNPFGPGPATTVNNTYLISGGAFTINSQNIVFSKNLEFVATGGIDGGSVVLSISGVNGVAPQFTIGTGSGQVQANLAAETIGNFLDFQPLGSAQFSVTTPGNIVATNTSTVIQFGPLGAGGRLNLDSETSTVSVGGVSGRDFNLLSLISNSQTTLEGSGAKGGNGITDTGMIFFGGGLNLSNSGPVATNGLDFNGTALTIFSYGAVSLSGQTSFSGGFGDNANGFTAEAAAAVGGTNGAVINITGLSVTGPAGQNFNIRADGGSLSPATLNITTFTTPVLIGMNSGQISLDLSHMAGSPLLSANTTITSDGPAPLKVDGSGIVYGGATGSANLGEGGTLTLVSAGPGFSDTGSQTPGQNLVLSNADLLIGLNFSTILFNTGSTTSAFVMTGAAAAGNGISFSAAVGAKLTAGTVSIEENQPGGSINTSGAAIFAHGLTLTTPTITFGTNQTITLQPDLSTGVGVNPTSPTGDGGVFTFTTAAFSFPNGPVTLIALGDGKTAASTGGQLNITDSQTTALNIGTTTFASVQLSNAFDKATGGQVAGTVNIQNTGNLIVNASVFTYGATGGKLLLTAPNILISNVSSLNQDSTGGLGLAQISFTTTSTTDFALSAATANGIADPAGTKLTASEIDITNNGLGGTGGINYGGGDQIEAATISLATPNTVTFTPGQTITAVEAPLTSTTPGQGGKISVSAGAVAFNMTGAGAVNLDAQGNSAAGTGGQIGLTINSGTTFNIGTVTGAFAFNVSNSSTGQAGMVSVANGGAVDVNCQGLTFGPTVTGGSGSLAVIGTNVLVSNIANLNTNPLAAVTFETTSSSDFVFGGATTNGFADAGATTLNATSLTVDNNATGSLTGGINTAGLGGSTTTVNVNTLILETLNTVTFASGATIVAVPNVTSGIGGTITIAAGSLAYTGATGVTLTAIAGAGGTGGNISVQTTGTNTLVVGNAGLTMDVAGAAGQTAGTISLTGADAVNVNCANLTFGPAEPSTGSGMLNITGTNLLISSVASLTPDLQSVTLTSTSSTDFSFGGATVNGFADAGATTLKAVALTLDVNTTGLLAGGINAVGLNGSVTTVSTHSLTLDTQNTITVPSGGNFTEFADTSAGGTGNAGSINLAAGALVITAGGGGFALDAVAKTGFSEGTGGMVTVAVGSTTTLTIGATGLGINVSNVSGQNGGTVSVTNGGAMTVDGKFITVGGTYPADDGAGVTLNVNGVLALKNVANFDPTGMSLLAFYSDSSQTFQLGTAGPGANGIADVGPTLAAQTIILTNAGGSITGGSLLSLNGSIATTLNASTDIGTALTAIALAGTSDPTNFSTITLNAGGNANVNSAITGTSLFNSATVIGTLQIVAAGGNVTLGSIGSSTGNFLTSNLMFMDTNAVGKNADTLTVGSITTLKGDLDISTNAQNVIVGDASTIITLQSNNGSINLNDTNVNSGSNILIEEFAVIHGTGAFPNLTQGNVSIWMGPAFTAAAGNPPAAATIITANEGAVQTGSTLNAAGTITVAGSSDVLSGLGRDLDFNTTSGLGAAAIALQANVTITADPPTGSGVLGQGAVQANANVLNAPAGAITLTGLAASPMGSGNMIGLEASPSGLGNYSAGSGNTSGNAALIAPSLVAPAGTSGAASSLQSSVNVINTPSSFFGAGSGLSVGTINNPTVGTMTVTNPGVSAGFLSSSGNSATVQSIAENAGEATVGNGSRSSLGRLHNTGGAQTLTGGVSNTSHKTLDRGPLLLLPEQNEVVETPYGSVSVAANSVALIISSKDGLAVYNLHDSRANAVVIKSGAKTVSVSPGRSAVLTRSARSFEVVNPAPFVSYRRLASQNVNSETKLYQAEFDIRSMMHGLKALNELMASDSARTRKTMGNVIKTAAILMQISPTSEPYALYLTPELTAFASSAHRQY